MSRILAMLTLISAVVAPCLTAAEEAEPIDPDQQRARELFERATEAYRARHLQKAISLVEEAYELYPHPGTLLNKALYHSEAGHNVAAYQSFLLLEGTYGSVITATTRGEVRRRLEQLRGQLAFATIATTPEGAEVAIDGESIGRAPFTEPVVLVPGSHNVTAGAEGYIPLSVWREVSPGETVLVELNLEAVEGEPSVGEEESETTPAPARLEIDSPTAGAVASIDDESPRPLPLSLELEAGQYTLRVEAEGYEPHRQSLELAEAEQLRLVIALQALAEPEPVAPEPRRRSFWHGPWPWIIGGLLVAGGTALVLALTLGDDGPTPDFQMELR